MLVGCLFGLQNLSLLVNAAAFQARWYWHSDRGGEGALRGDQGKATGASGKPDYTLQVGTKHNTAHGWNSCHLDCLGFK